MYSIHNNHISTQKPVARRVLWVGLTLALMATAIVIALELTGRTSIFGDNTPPRPTAGQNTKGEVEDGTSKLPAPTTNTQNTSTEADDEKRTGSVGTQAAVIAPTGNFVSAHKNVPLDAPLSSVCNTTAGARCVITFTSGNTKKSLPEQPTDRGGTAYWNSWTPKSIGLTPGEWKIQAVATLGEQTKSADDALTLEVTQ